MTTTDTRIDRLEHRIGREGLLVLRVHDGDVRIRGIAGDTARVHTRDGEPLDRFEIERGEASLTIQATGTSARGALAGIPTRSVDLVVEVPEAATVFLEAASADIEAEHLTGEQRLSTASGDLSIRDVEGTLTVDAVSGDVDIRAKGPLAAIARTVSGDLGLEAPVLRSLQAQTTSGDIVIAGRFEGDGPFRIETVSGDTSLTPTGDFRVEATTLTGDIQGEHHRPSRDRGPIVVGSETGPTIVFRSTSGDLGISPGRSTSSAAPKRVGPADERPTQSAPEPTTDDAAETDALDILRALERGDIDLDEARRRLSGAERAEDQDDA